MGGCLLLSREATGGLFLPTNHPIKTKIILPSNWIAYRKINIFKLNSVVVVSFELA